MNLSTKFAVSVHILSVLYFNKDKACSSELIAGSVNTNPVVIRRLVSKLKAAGLVNTAPGQRGVRVAREPEDIPLLEVYEAVDNMDSLLFGLHENTNPACPVGLHLNSVLREEMDSMQAMLKRRLSDTTMADVMKSIYAKIV